MHSAEIPQSPIPHSSVRQGRAQPAGLNGRTKVTVVVGDNREYSLEAEYGTFCLGFGLALVLAPVLLHLLLLYR